MIRRGPHIAVLALVLCCYLSATLVVGAFLSPRPAQAAEAAAFPCPAPPGAHHDRTDPVFPAMKCFAHCAEASQAAVSPVLPAPAVAVAADYPPVSTSEQDLAFRLLRPPRPFVL